MRASAAAVRQSIERDTEYADTLVQRMRDDAESDWPDRLVRNMSDGRAELTPTELDALRSASFGMTADESAVILGVSLYRIESRLTMARHKLRAKNTTHACCLALRQGLIA